MNYQSLVQIIEQSSKIPEGTVIKREVTADLEIEVEVQEYDICKHFDVGMNITLVLDPHKMKFRNELIGKNPGLPEGLYWRVHMIDGWKFDVWALNSKLIKKNQDFTNRLLGKLNPFNRKIILDIKTRISKNPHYTNDVISVDIYKAVLEKGVCSFDEFAKLIFNEKGIDINSRTT